MFTSQNGDFDIQKTHINGKGAYVVTAGLTNNGILGKTDIEAKIFKKNTITVDMFGNAFYRQFDYKMVTHARVFSLTPNFSLTERQGLFLANSFRYLRNEFGFDNMCSWGKIKSKTIQLPCTDNEIDLDFMELFIADLETYRVVELQTQQTSELQNYLTVSGFDNYELSEEELKSLQEYPNTEFDEFDILDVFTVKNTSNILSSDIVGNSGETPYLCASAENNSVSSYIKYNEKYLEEGNCIFIGGKTFVVSYQEKGFYSNDSHNLALYLNNQAARTKLTQLYIAACVYKSLSHQYSWGNSVSKAKIKGDKILLPTKDGVVDFDVMETFISAIQKLVIKDVVMDNDVKINATKRVVLNNS